MKLTLLYWCCVKPVLAFICHASNRKGNGWTLSRSTALSGLSDLIRPMKLTLLAMMLTLHTMFSSQQ